MIEKDLVKYFEDKKVIILGFGREGKSSYNFLRKNFDDMKIEIVDENKNLIEENPYLKEDKNLEFNLSSDFFKDIDNYDVVLKTPGISLKDYDITNFRDKVKSQLELLFEFIPCFKIGITGTKGKSTTSTLIYNMLKDQGRDTLLLGNIGEPYFNYFDSMNEETILVLELSSHALEFVSHSPNIAILLDIYPEHLDHHNNVQEYIDAKFNIAKFQNENDTFIYNAVNDIMKAQNFNYKDNDYAVYGRIDDTDSIKEKHAVYISNNRIIIDNEDFGTSEMDRTLKGEHNLNNILFALTVCKLLKLDFNKAYKTIADFKTLSHRLELVGTYNDITYYDDSISTIPEAAINAVLALDNVNTILLGGMDRGVDLSKLYNFLKTSNVENIICMYKTGEYIYNELKDSKKCILVKDLAEAVAKAKEVTRKGSICLLSPSSASYGYFKNFEERGDKFQELVKE